MNPGVRAPVSLPPDDVARVKGHRGGGEGVRGTAGGGVGGGCSGSRGQGAGPVAMASVSPRCHWSARRPSPGKRRWFPDGGGVGERTSLPPRGGGGRCPGRPGSPSLARAPTPPLPPAGVPLEGRGGGGGLGARTAGFSGGGEGGLGLGLECGTPSRAGAPHSPPAVLAPGWGWGGCRAERGWSGVRGTGAGGVPGLVPSPIL